MTTFETIAALYGQRGGEVYFGEQSRCSNTDYRPRILRAKKVRPLPWLLAALLHDVGHLVESVPEDIADWRHDAHHEEVAAWLARYFGPEVSGPVGLHVPPSATYVRPIRRT